MNSEFIQFKNPGIIVNGDKKYFFRDENFWFGTHVLYLVIEWKCPRCLMAEEHGANMK